jgi:hypothetical protein
LTKAKAKLRATKQGARVQTKRAVSNTRVRSLRKRDGAGLMIMVPIETLKMLRMRAAETGSTVRALVLESLQKCGYSVPTDELMDRRRRSREVAPKKALSVQKSFP